MVSHALVMQEALLYPPKTKGKPFTIIRSCADTPEE